MLLLMIVSICLSPFLIVGFLFELSYNLITLKWKKGGMAIWYLMRLSWDMLMWFLSNAFRNVAIFIDYLGNVLLGGLIRNAVTEEKGKHNLLGMPLVTISAALGQLIFTENINAFGRLFVRILSVFEPNHCARAYKDYLRAASQHIGR